MMITLVLMIEIERGRPSAATDDCGEELRGRDKAREMLQWTREMLQWTTVLGAGRGGS